MHLSQGGGREYFARGTRDAQPMTHIMQRFLSRQGLQVIASGNALRQLAKVSAVQQLAQLRLTDQYDLQKLLRRGFQVGQEPDLLEDLGGQILRFIDDDYDTSAFGMGR